MHRGSQILFRLFEVLIIKPAIMHVQLLLGNKRPFLMKLLCSFSCVREASHTQESTNLLPFFSASIAPGLLAMHQVQEVQLSRQTVLLPLLGLAQGLVLGLPQAGALAVSVRH